MLTGMPLSHPSAWLQSHAAACGQPTILVARVRIRRHEKQRCGAITLLGLLGFPPASSNARSRPGELA